jgi:hypothetical protein
MLSFLYGSGYETPMHYNRWLFHADVATLADKYFISPLQNYADFICGKQFDEFPSFSHFADAISVAYDTGNEILKELLIAVATSRYQVLFAEPVNAKLQQVLQETPEFGVDVAEHLEKKLAAAERETCLNFFLRQHISMK